MYSQICRSFAARWEQILVAGSNPRALSMSFVLWRISLLDLENERTMLLFRIEFWQTED